MKLKQMDILQITPAAGFTAAFASEEGTVYTRPLACWALIKRTFELSENEWDVMQEPESDLPIALERGEPLVITRVEGMANLDGADIKPCENDDFFLGYVGPGENPLDLQEQARELIDSLEDMDDDEDEDEFDFDFDDEDHLPEFDPLSDGLPQALSHLSVQVQERLKHGDMPPLWEQGGWLEFMKRFGDLSGG